MIAVRVVRDAAVVREAVFPGLPVSFGRGPGNDVVLFDPSVSRRHAVLEEGPDGRPVLRDLSSRNGLHQGPARMEAAPLEGILRCRLGMVELEIEALSPADTQEVRQEDLSRFEHRRTVTDHLRYLAIGAVGWLLVLVLDPSFWSPWQQNRSGLLARNVLGILVGLPVTGFALLGMLKAAGRRVRMADTLKALALMTWVALAADVVSQASYYALPVAGHSLVDELLGSAVLVWATVHVASLRKPGPRRRFQVAWGAVAAALVLGIHATTQLDAQRSGQPQAGHHVQVPLGSYAGPARGLDGYQARVQAAAEEAARRAEEVRLRQGD
jgi:hypothetical protein